MKQLRDIFGAEPKAGNYLVGKGSYHKLIVGRYILTTPGGVPSVVYNQHGNRTPLNHDFLVLDARSIPFRWREKLDEGFAKACEKLKIKVN